MTDLAGWDAFEAETALAAVAVPVVAIQSTTMDSALQRVSLTTDRSSPWLDLIRTQVLGAAVTLLPGIERNSLGRGTEFSTQQTQFAQPGCRPEPRVNRRCIAASRPSTGR